MPKIYCSKKLSEFLGLKADAEEQIHLGDAWNGHLFYVNRKKYILFMEKKTLYSFVLIDVKKKDLKDFKGAFVNWFIEQLKRDFAINQETENEIIKDYQDIVITGTDNDKRVIGSMNDCVQNIKCFKEENFEREKRMLNFIEKLINEVPMGALKYFTSKEVMEVTLTDFSSFRVNGEQTDLFKRTN
jgi:hypothetical protein